MSQLTSNVAELPLDLQNLLRGQVLVFLHAVYNITIVRSWWISLIKQKVAIKFTFLHRLFSLSGSRFFIGRSLWEKRS